MWRNTGNLLRFTCLSKKQEKKGAFAGFIINIDDLKCSFFITISHVLSKRRWIAPLGEVFLGILQLNVDCESFKWRFKNGVIRISKEKKIIAIHCKFKLERLSCHLQFNRVEQNKNHLILTDRYFVYWHQKTFQKTRTMRKSRVKSKP